MTSTVGIAFIQVEFIGAGALAIGDIRLFRSKRYRIYFREEFLGETRGCLWVVQVLLWLWLGIILGLRDWDTHRRWFRLLTMSCTARAVSETLLLRRIGVRGIGMAAGMSGFTLSTGVMGRRTVSLLALSALVLRLACAEGGREWAKWGRGLRTSGSPTGSLTTWS